MKQTAVEWLLNNLISEPYSEADFKHNKECWNKAEEMEKNQIGKAFLNGRIKEIGSGVLFDLQPLVETYDNYYNETFKSE
jgi:hypothetical protein